MQRSRFLAPGDKLGKHDLIRQIAVGGMAELYLARTMGIEGFEKLVVVKRILPQYSDNTSFVNMFLNEARLAATLHHPNIAQVYDIGQENGEYFFSMEYVHGEDLGRFARSAHEGGVPISLDAALTLITGLCAGLHHAHEKTTPDGRPLNVVHRDVSPSNVLVSYDGGVKLVDFGIARVNTTPGSTAGGLKGKISYMSPEQCRGKTVLDRRSDVFSVGTILYELTTGQLPFTDETEYAILNHIVNTDAVPPGQLVKDYPPALETIVMRALARDTEQRYATALELQSALEDFAHENRLRVSPLVLARMMSTLFPQRLEEWANARAQGAFFVEQHVVRTLIESSRTDGQVLPDTPEPREASCSSPPPRASSQAPVAGEMAPEPDDESTAVSTPPIGPDEELTDVRTPRPVPGARSTPVTPSPTPIGLRQPTAPTLRSAPLIPHAPSPTPAPHRSSTPITQVAVPAAAEPASVRNMPHRINTPVPGLPGAVPILPLPRPQPGTLVSNPNPNGSHEVPVIAVHAAGELTERVHVPDLAMRKRRSKLRIALVLVGALGAATIAYVVLGRDDGSVQDPSQPTATKPEVKPVVTPTAEPVKERVADTKVEPAPKAEPNPDEPKPEPAAPDPPREPEAQKPAVQTAVKKTTPPPKVVVVKKPPPKPPPPKDVKKPDPKPDPKPDAKEPQWKTGDSPFMPVRPADKR